MSVLKISGPCRQLFATLIVNILSVHMGVAFGWLLMMKPIQIFLRVISNEPVIIIDTSGKISDEDHFMRRLSFLCILAVLPLVAFISERFGRRIALATSTIPFILFCLTIAAAKNSTWIVVAMIFGAVACAMQLYLVPMYVSEISSANRRGVYGIIRTMFVGIGLYFGVFQTSVRLTPIYAIFSLILPMLFLMGLKIVPESPVWLARKERIYEATRAQDWLRIDEKSYDRSEAERLNEGLGNINEIDSQPVAFKDIFKSAEVRKGLGVTIGLVIGQAVLQINWIICWLLVTESISFWIRPLTPLNMVFYVTMCIVTMLMIDTVGRRPLLIISCTTLITIFSGFFAWFILIQMQNFQWIIPAEMIFVSLAGLLMSSYIIGMGSVPFVIAVEIVPNNVISYVYAISTGFFWIATWTVAETWQSILTNFHVTYWCIGYTVICVFLLILVCTSVPETKAKPVVSRGKIWKF